MDVYLRSGNDVFIAEGGTVDGIVTGVSGNDTLDLSEFGAGIWVDLGDSTAWGGEIWTRDDNGVSSGGWRHVYDTDSFENVTLTPFTDVIFGSEVDNWFTASEFTPENTGMDRIYGGGGADMVDYSALDKGLSDPSESTIFAAPTPMKRSGIAAPHRLQALNRS